ncbi:MAG: Asp-tRNA(Asn)/Glu-tRNA(Gln) amidotransferase subunit GatA [Chitinophagales bacterium]
MEAYINLQTTQIALQNGTQTCVTIVQHYLQCIDNKQHLNAYLEVFENDALNQAAIIDNKIRNGENLGQLFGLVIAIKDVLCYKGHQVSAASNMLKGFTSLYSATAVERLIQEDAIIIGRLNCDEFAMGSTNENSAYGIVHNDLDNNKVPGGSSGGSAVAVQAGTCMAALGTDTGGSVRQPAAFCGVVGFKPTYGRISRHGLIAYASSFDQIGTLTHNIEDAARITQVMAGKDVFDATSSSEPVPNYSQYLASSTSLSSEKKTYRIAYIKEALEHPGLDPEIRQQTAQLLHDLAKAGHVVEAVDFPHLDYIVSTYYILTTAEASSNLARFDGIHYGYRNKTAKNMEQTYRQSRTEGFGKEVKRRIMLGTFVLSAGYYDAYYAKAQKVRRLLANATQTIFQTHDFIVMPTTPTTAFDIGDKAYQDPVSMYLADIFTVQANLVGVPGISLPLFQHSNKLPFGFQILADKFKETDLLKFADYLMKTQQQII